MIGWLRTRVCKHPIIVLYFDSEKIAKLEKTVRAALQNKDTTHSTTPNPVLQQ